MITFYIPSKRLSLKCNGLFDGKVSLLNKTEYGSAVYFLYSCIKYLNSISDE